MIGSGLLRVSVFTVCGWLLLQPAAAQPSFDKSFSPNPVPVREATTLTFTINNRGRALAATGLDFTDNLPARLVVATPPNAGTTCIGGTLTAVAGTGSVTYTGGTVPARSSCTVFVDIVSPALGSYLNVSGDLTSSAGNSGRARAFLAVRGGVGFTKVFGPNPAVAGSQVTMVFQVDNTHQRTPAKELDFTDNFPAGLKVATNPNALSVCVGGTLTATPGANFVSYTGGEAPAGSTCVIRVDITPDAPGSYVNTTGDLTSSLGNHGPATATLDVVEPSFTLGFSKAFTPDNIDVGGVSTLNFTIDNTANGTEAFNVNFKDVLPSGLAVATPANASETCTAGTAGGMITATPGGNSISYSQGAVFRNAVCTVEVDVTGTTVGSFTNTSGDLVSTFGSSGSATATIAVGVNAPGFVKAFSPNPVDVGVPSTLTFTIDNSTNAAAATALDFTDNFPVGLVVATPPNAGTTCAGGTLTAAPGSTVVSYTGGSAPASGACTVQVDVAGTSVGTFENVSGNLTSSFGDSGLATAMIVVGENAARIISQTREVIRNFMNRRADQITISDPDLTSHFDGPAGSSLPLDVNASYDPEGAEFSFSTRLSHLAYAAQAGDGEETRHTLSSLGYLEAASMVEPGAPRFDIWAEGTFSGYNDSAAGADTEGHFGLLYVGGEFRARPNLLLGFLAQFDWTDEEDTNTNIGADGTGWMAGPYVVGRLGQNLYVQARGAWGMSDNHVSPFATYTDGFDTTRWLASGKVEGRFHAGQWRFSPTAGIVYFQEEQHSYTDSNGFAIPSQTVALGRATFGPEVGYRMGFADGGYIEPHLGMTGVFDFDKDGKVLGGLATAADTLRARMTGGVTYHGGNGTRFEASGFYDGLGDSNFETYGGKLGFVLPLN